ncbi:DUF808 domain-containing protein [Acinetobacter gerneri]|uniref:DUF808 domain-containing protein n=1 Tax=Acinetobacter gerneri TaxID=202952 RepID=A0AAW8JRM6_9GAMM|nr:DUF808 domain-containing protein [Acinetobacter gerneri]MDQ9012129.1 DUF808 domain-containing protein [Acinetobacter gerneri]MDQ9016161.1 DUF808 domain-containing protein [Acinetobacter gerneri]MDQ9027395.1 DUF808 domain-containing protein [Acinetobacter gerneri]MDQ9054698.1 DUF808 domain-containing protein [Acinetobacter gerneri]MDQ9062352.1 DUF808 domain-containing protein [Acinetobacter gerneri]
MASSLLILLDDIATVLDDVAVMSKVAAKKTAGVLGDDLALNAQQVSGVRSEREIPVVLGVAKGSFVNKLILVPLALLISVVAESLISPLLMIGGLFLCYEGVEKVIHTFQHKKAKTVEDATEELNEKEIDLATFEKEKIKGAIRTDFVLSAEIVVISLGTVATTSFANKVAVLSIIAVIMTVGVYGFVAMIVKIDDLGLYLTKKVSTVQQSIGRGLLAFAPILMKTLTFVGTIAMFLVGGGIINHAVPVLHHLTENTVDHIEHIPSVGNIIGAVTPTLLNFGLGIIAGFVVLLIVKLFGKIWKKSH